MIVVDASALVAIVREEEEALRFGEVLVTQACIMAAPSLLEVKMVLSSILPAGMIDHAVGSLLDRGEVRVLDFTPAMADAAIAAFRTYGKGRGHPAQLNFGDCMAYGVAKVLDVPLLYKGGDFALTDIRPALA